MTCDYPLRVHAKEGPAAVPCGRCPPCRQRRVDAWTFRLQKEQERSISTEFITLTYDTTHVPITDNGFMTLRKRDFQLFMKLLRKTNDHKLVYYACGEYGTQKKRPHYHIILFNLIPTYTYETDKTTLSTYISIQQKLDSAWPHGSVFIDPNPVTSSAMAYCTKYVNKPGRIPMHKNDDRSKEFSCMSKNIGSNYLTPETIQYHRKDPTRNYLTLPGGYKKALPKYYREKIYDEQDMQYQRSQIHIVKQDEEKQLRDDLQKKYGDEVSYNDYIDEQKRQRLTRFWKNVTPREIPDSNANI